jgi:uncharacterized protein YjdB
VSGGTIHGVAQGAATVSASFRGVSASLPVSVTTAVLTSISVGGASSFPLGVDQAFTATGTFSDLTQQDLTAQATWATGDSAVATVSPSGLVHPVAAGPTTVTAALNGLSGSTDLTVSSAMLQSIDVIVDDSTFAAGTTVTLQAVGTYSDLSTQQLTTGVTWASDDLSVVNISTAGQQAIAQGVQKGTAHVTASYGLTSPPTLLTVTGAKVVSLAVTPATVPLLPGLTGQLTATGTFSDGTTQDVTTQVAWSTSADHVATVSNAPTTAGRVTGLATGTATVTASLSNVSASSGISVAAATLQQLTVSPATTSAAPGSAVQFRVEGAYSDGSTLDLTSSATWTSSDPTVATVSGGTARGVHKGVATISATKDGLTGSAQLTVTDPVLQSLTLSPASTTLPVGSVSHLALVATYSDAITRDVTGSALWSTADASIATVDAGAVTGLAGGTVTITASFGGLTATAPVTVSNAALLEIVVDPQQTTLPPLFDQAFTATGIYSDGQRVDLTGQVTWATGDTSVGTISPSGLVHPLAAGATSISATLGAVTGSTVLTISNATVQSVEIDPPIASIAKGTAVALQAIATYSDGSVLDVSSQATTAWSSSAPSAVTVVATGTQIAAEGRAVGTATVTANFGGTSGTASITVSASPLVSIAIDPASLSIPKGLSQQLTLTGTRQDGMTQDLTVDPGVIWTSSDPKVAAVSGGMVTSVAAGTATITASLLGLQVTSELTVTSATILSLAVTPPTASLPVGYQTTFKAIGTYSDATTQDVTALATWTSSRTSVAVVSTSGGTLGQATATATGSTTITASYGGASATSTLTVTNPTLVSVAVTPNPFSVAVGGKKQLVAKGTFTDGTTLDITRQCNWSSSPKNVAWVSKKGGLVTGTTSGSVTVTAKKGSKKGTATGTVQ